MAVPHGDVPKAGMGYYDSIEPAVTGVTVISEVLLVLKLALMKSRLTSN